MSNNQKWYKLGPFTIFDTETTGMSPTKDKIVEIAAIRVEIDGSESSFQSLINPKRNISRFATRVHNITNEMVKKEPTFEIVGANFLKFAEGSTIVAHNARFDLSFLQENLSSEMLPLWSGKTMDSIPIIKSAYPGLPSYSLQNLRVRFGLGSENDGAAHRALADAKWTLEIFQMAMQSLIDSREEWESEE